MGTERSTTTDDLHARLRAAVLRHVRHVRQGEAEARAACYHDALDEAARLVERFREIDPELGRVVLFGSMVRGVPRNAEFDIDLSFEGREYYRCVAVALRSRFKVDLIDYRSAAPHIKDAIDTEGRVLYAPNP